MEVFRLLPPAEQRRPCALTIGNFDGVHRGHQAVLAALRARADALGVPSCVLTFEPHPREFFAELAGKPESAPARILTERDKLDALAEHGVDRVCVAHFNASLANLAAESFIDEIIVDGLQARHLLIGDDFRFGARRRGDFAMLEAASAQHGFGLARMDTVTDDGGRISSSSVRGALETGDFALAQRLLGRPYFISGHVVRGRQLGRTIGFPTLNIRIPFARPAVHGVFVVQVHGVGEAPWPAVASLGTRPAVERDGKLLLEVHLFDFSGDLYGRLLRVEFLQRLREERHYDGLEALTAQIRLDAQDARDFFARRDAAASAG
ncbi:MAG: bifunctional riboflavin kinase/FAD synthetase [Gammaproteobacteria bacterium]|jgi:riboflavin kinase/FMN adenylyltransferase